jgi:MFS family permease
MIVWVGVPGNRRPTRGDADESACGVPAAPARVASLRQVVKDRLTIAYLALTLVYCFVYLQAYTTLPLAMRLHGLSPQAYGLAMTVNGILIVALQPVASRWLATYRKTAVLAVGFAIVGLGFGLTAAASSTAAYAATVAVWTLGEIVTAGIGPAIMADLAPAHMRGRYSGAYGAVWSAAYLIGPLGGTRWLAIGAPVLWLACGGLGMGAAAGLLLFGRSIGRRTDGASPSGNGYAIIGDKPSDAPTRGRR